MGLTLSHSTAPEADTNRMVSRAAACALSPAACGRVSDLIDGNPYGSRAGGIRRAQCEHAGACRKQ